MLSEALASSFARVALAHADRRAIGHLDWLLVRVLRLYPMLAENGGISAALDARLAPAAIEANPGFERADDCAWALELQAEALRMRSRWSRALAPLAQRLSSRMAEFAAQGSSAFACILALDYARAAGDLALDMEIRRAARRRYGAVRGAPLADESLSEAVLMRELLEPAEFAPWLNAFLPSGVGPLAEPSAEPEVCLLRAWCLSALGLRDAAAKNLAAAMPHAIGGEPWLATVAVLALSEAALKSP